MADSLTFLLNHPGYFFFFLLLSMLLVEQFSYRLGRRLRVNDSDTRHEQIIASRDALRLLLSLLLGFTLAMVLPRFEQRREAVVAEANALGTTFLRARLLEPPLRDRMQHILAEYVDLRISGVQLSFGSPDFQRALDRSGQLQNDMWDVAREAAARKDSPTTGLFVASVNDTIDNAENRLAAAENRVPSPVWIMLLIISFLTSVATGYSAKDRVWLSALASPLMIAVVMCLIADMDSPRRGLIRTDLSSLLRVQQQIHTPLPPAVNTPVPSAPATRSTPARP